MIKGLTLLAAVPSPDVLDRVASLFSALGFEPGKSWSTAEAQGAPFLAPLGAIEFFTGPVPQTPSVLVETIHLGSVHEAASEWFQTHAKAGDTLGAVEATAWNSRLFTLTLGNHLTLGFWESEQTVAGAPVALEGDLSAQGRRFAIVVARWNAVITDRLLQGAIDALTRSGCARTDIEVVRVPGAWEVPSAARTLAETRRFDAILTLAVLLRGETAHYEAIYTEVARGIGQSQQETGVPHAFGVLTCETLEQALDRAGLKAGNKGFEAAIAAIEMASINAKLGLQKTGAQK
jgi:6,7-dimethyl-8-ribityllumazine synthase